MKLNPGDLLRPVYPVYDKTGKRQLVASEDPDDLITVTKPSDLQVALEDADAGDYRVGFLIVDLAGHRTARFQNVTVAQ
jgi:hypothetical protein